MNSDSALTTFRHERLVVAGIIAAFIALSIGFSLAPIFEGLDETAHYRFVRELVATGALPDPTQLPKAQYHQAPLYYFLAAPVLMLIPDDDFKTIAPINRSFGFDIAHTGNDNKNLRVHSRAEAFPYSASGTALAAHLMRLISIAIGAGTVIASYAIFRLLWPDRPATRLLALGLVAFWPQFVWMSSLISNDNLIFLLATLSLLLLLRQLRDGVTWQKALLLGIVLGAALLAKANGVFLAFPVGVAFLLERKAWKFAPLTLGVTLAIAGWWYVRNILLYNDISGMAVALEAWQGGPIPANQQWDALLTRTPFVYQTFWARFGNTSVPVGEGLYLFFDLLTLIASVGLVAVAVRAARKSPPRQDSPSPLGRGARGEGAIVLAVFQLSWIGSVAYGSMIAWNANQGRYLLPGVAVWGAMLALGVETWIPSAWRKRAAFSLSAVMASVTAISLFGYFLPAYRPLPLPLQIDAPLAYRYPDAAELIGMSPARPQARPGETITITLYWRAIQPTPSRLTAYLHTVDSNMVKRDSLPATGNLLSTEWLPGQGWAERYIIPIPDDAAPGVYTLIAGLYDPEANFTLPAFDASGSQQTPVIGELVIVSDQ